VKNIFLPIIISLLFHTSFCQTRSVREKVKQDKDYDRSDGHLYSAQPSDPLWEPDFYDLGFGEMVAQAFVYVTIYAAYKGLWYGQYAVMQHRDERPELVSLQGSLSGGYNYQNNVFLINPSVRVNYGIFASDLRYINIQDVTGKMHSLDWQVLMLRLPIRSFKLEYGLGFSYFLSPSKIYFEQSFGFDWSLFNNKAGLQAQFRKSQNTFIGLYRKEYTIDIDAKVAQRGRLGFYPFLGYSRHEYFNDINFDFIRMGMKVRLF